MKLWPWLKRSGRVQTLRLPESRPYRAPGIAELEYCLKPGYNSREKAAYFVDELAEKQGIIHQPDVYPFAAEILRAAGGKTLIDLGCGQGRKLAPLHPEFDLIGVDFGANLDWCRTHHGFGRWIEHDFEGGQLLAVPDEWNLDGAGVVCSDVVEHLVHPERLLESVASLLERASFALFTTPERDLVRGRADMGPPANPHHVREWNLAEFCELLSASGLDLWARGLTINNNQNWRKTTIAALARRRGLRSEHPDNDFRVLAIICAHNEADVIEHTLDYLIRQGIETVLIDNWSTDGTAAKAQAFIGKGLLRIERFPESGPTGTYDWYNLLTRVEDVALGAEADWIIHHDADEVRESPWPELSLREALYQVDRENYNCVNYTCLVFQPTPQSERMGGKVPCSFQHFEFGKRPGHFRQLKTWKKQPGRVSLADSGGHDVNFLGRRVYPLRFLLKHYPIRSQEHGVRKVYSERLRRFNAEERNGRGWHTHYDIFEGETQTFIRNPRDLILFDPHRFADDYLTERLTSVGILR